MQSKENSNNSVMAFQTELFEMNISSYITPNYIFILIETDFSKFKNGIELEIREKIPYAD